MEEEKPYHEKKIYEKIEDCLASDGCKEFCDVLIPALVEKDYMMCPMRGDLVEKVLISQDYGKPETKVSERKYICKKKQLEHVADSRD